MSFDPPARNARFRERFSFEFPLLCDTDRTMGLAYGAARRPGVGGAARRVGVIIDPEGQIAFYARSVNPLTFPKRALEML